MSFVTEINLFNKTQDSALCTRGTDGRVMRFSSVCKLKTAEKENQSSVFTKTLFRKKEERLTQAREQMCVCLESTEDD